MSEDDLDIQQSGEQNQQQEQQQEQQEQREDYEQKFRSTDGRLRQLNEALANAGYSFDPNTNSIVAPGGSATNQQYQQQYNTTQQYQQPESEEDDGAWMFDPKAMSAHIEKIAQEKAMNIVGNAFGTLMPVIDSTVESVVGQSTPDWKDIKDGVLQSAKELGIGSLSALKANPKAFELIVNAERGKRATAAQMNPQAEIERLQRLNAAASAGNASAVQQSSSSGYDFDEDDRQYMKARNMTEEQYFDFINGPAQIKFGGNS